MNHAFTRKPVQPLAAAGQLVAIIRTEVMMQWRRWGFWLAFAIFLVILLLILVPQAKSFEHIKHLPYFQGLDDTAVAHFYLGIAATYNTLILGTLIALLVADRMVRDHMLHMAELQQATPLSYLLYVTGKFLGNYIAILLPAFLVYMIIGIVTMTIGAPIVIIPVLLQGFLLVFLASFAITISCTLLLSSFMPLRSVQIGAPLLWLYCNTSPFDWSTPKNTIFNPSGAYIREAFFQVGNNWPAKSLVEGYQSLGALYGMTVVALALTIFLLALRAQRDATGSFTFQRETIRERPSTSRITPDYTVKTTFKQHMTPREFLLFAAYQIRLLTWWLFVLMLIGFAGSAFIFWTLAHRDTPEALIFGAKLGRFVLETGAGIIAAALTSSLVVGDPILEVTMATRSGIQRVLAWRYVLTILILLLCSLAFLLYTLTYPIHYTLPQTPLTLLFIWLAPVLMMSMVGLLGALVTRSAALGTVLSITPILACVFLHDDIGLAILNYPFLKYVFNLIFVPFTLFVPDKPNDWWLNRGELLIVAAILFIFCWQRLRREEHLLGVLR